MICQVMKLREQHKSAFNSVDCLCCLGVVFLFLCVALPGLANNRGRSQQIVCIDNLRLIGRAVQLWQADHSSHETPWGSVVVEGGTGPREAQAYLGFRMLSNELVSPKVLVCPSDLSRISNAADNWSTSTNGGYANARYRDNATSYTLTYHSFFTMPNSLLSSDRNLRVDSYARICSFSPLPGLFSEIFMGAQPTATWTNNVHGFAGNILHTDGRVTQTSSNSLKNYLGSLRGTPTNEGSIHLLVP